MSAYEGQAVARWTSPEDRVWTQSGHVPNQISAMQAISRPVGLCYRLGWEKVVPTLLRNDSGPVRSFMTAISGSWAITLW